METKEVIRKTKQFHDFYGQDLSDTTKLKTKGDCLSRLMAHRRFLEEQVGDALAHIDSFVRELGLD
jgi:hypothetical protein